MGLSAGVRELYQIKTTWPGTLVVFPTRSMDNLKQMKVVLRLASRAKESDSRNQNSPKYDPSGFLTQLNQSVAP